MNMSFNTEIIETATQSIGTKIIETTAYMYSMGTHRILDGKFLCIFVNTYCGNVVDLMSLPLVQLLNNPSLLISYNTLAYVYQTIGKSHCHNVTCTCI